MVVACEDEEGGAPHSCCHCCRCCCCCRWAWALLYRAAAGASAAALWRPDLAPSFSTALACQAVAHVLLASLFISLRVHAEDLDVPLVSIKFR